MNSIIMNSFAVFLVIVSTCLASRIGILFLFCSTYKIFYVLDIQKIQHRILEDVINSTIESLRPDIPDPLIIQDLEIAIPENEFIK